MKTKMSAVFLTLLLGLCQTPVQAQNSPSTAPGNTPPPPPRNDLRGFPGGGPRGGRWSGAAFQSTPQARDDAEKKILEVLEEMRQSERGMSAPLDDARFLRILIESTGAKQAVELGTFHGYSAIWMCLGLRTTGGKLTTYEIDKDSAATSRNNFKRAGVESLVNLVEGDAHKEIGKMKESIDLVFIDADKEGYLDYINQLLPQVRPGGLIVAHNITPGMADPAYIKAITTNVVLETLFISTGNEGMSLSMKKR